MIRALDKKKIHFIGIGGIGMSALARYFSQLGYSISGSDKESSSLINDLKAEGIKNIWTPHSLSNIKSISPDYIIYSTAITQENEEIIWAKENKKDILHRSALLELATKEKKLIAVSGTHGKTSTTSMLTEALIGNGLNPSLILGGVLQSKNTNAIYGQGEYFITEADESDKSFLKGEPEISIITNVEPDHLENYPKGIEEIKASFLEFAQKSIAKTGLVVCLADSITNEIITNNFDLNNPKLVTYGLHNPSNSYTLSTQFNSKQNSYEIFLKNNYLFNLKLQSPGLHNILNALAVLGICHLLKLDLHKIKNVLEDYKGVKRRFEILSNVKDMTIIDDYAHHPTEIKFTYTAAKELKPKRLVIIFQPHQVRRLKDLWNDFVKVFQDVDENTLVFITETYIARGKEIEGITSKSLVSEIDKSNVNYLPGNMNQIAKHIESIIKKNDLIITMGAGNITNLGPLLLKSHEGLALKTGNN